MAQVDKVHAFLSKGTSRQGQGVTVAYIADRTRVPKNSVRKRVYDLRTAGHRIYSNYRTVNGERKLYYRMASTA